MTMMMMMIIITINILLLIIIIMTLGHTAELLTSPKFGSSAHSHVQVGCTYQVTKFMWQQS